MTEGWRPLLMRWLRVPPEPQPPAGAPGSIRVFRSGRNALRLSLAAWGLKQVAAVAGLVFWIALLGHLRAVRAADGSSSAEPPGPAWLRPGSRIPPIAFLHQMAVKAPSAVVGWITVAEFLSLATFLVLLPLTYGLRRLEYEQRWYIVTDRSLRLRSGLWKVREITMSFANLQQISIRQDPVQRLLGLADVRVQSAGGGTAPPAGEHHGAEPTHTGFFHAVDNAPEIRDLIVERLRQYRESGLGDPDEPVHPDSSASSPAVDAPTVTAAKELLAEARELRHLFK